MMPERQTMFSSAHRVENSMEEFDAQNLEGCLQAIGFLSKNALNRNSALQGDPRVAHEWNLISASVNRLGDVAQR